MIPTDGGGVCSAGRGTGVRDDPAAEGKRASGPTKGKASQYREDKLHWEVAGENMQIVS